MMKLISFNVNNDYRGVVENAEAIRGMLLKHEPDVVGLQEVTPAMYDALHGILDGAANMSTKPPGRSYFNVMVSRFPEPIVEVPLEETSMGRSFLRQRVASCGTTFVTTHLESMPASAAVRAAQCRQIMRQCNHESSSLIVFGDTNFMDDERNELTDRMTYLGPPTTVYTYDSLLNPLARPPFRSNLDRFYASSGLQSSEIEILKDVAFSDHFPIICSFDAWGAEEGPQALKNK